MIAPDYSTDMKREAWFAAVGLALTPFLDAAATRADPRTTTTPVSVQELDTNVTLDSRRVWEAELDLENRTQGIPGVFGPFAVLQQQRETIWLHHAQTKALRWSIGYAAILREAIPQVGARSYFENRYYARVRMTQPNGADAHYEEIWLQVRDFPDNSGAPLLFPGIRLRYGQQYRLGRGADHSLEAYEELSFKFAPASFSTTAVDHLRFNIVYSFPIEPGMALQAGVRLQDAAGSSRGTYNFSYGPVFVLKYRP